MDIPIYQSPSLPYFPINVLHLFKAYIYYFTVKFMHSIQDSKHLCITHNFVTYSSIGI
jgi:hypothetical protein